MASLLSALAGGAAQVLGRTLFLQTNTATGIPVPLAVLDVVKNEVVEYDSEISEHPVEQGTEVSDHQQLHNPTIRLKGTISSTPLDLSVAIANIAAGTLAAISSSQARSNLLNSGLSVGTGIVGAALQGNAGNIAANAFAGAVDAVSRTILLYCYQNKTPFTVITKRASYTNCLIKRLSFPRDENTGYALDFEMDIRQIRIVTPIKVQKTQLDESIISTAASSTNLGNQATQLASNQVQSAVSSSSLGSVPGVASKSPGFFT